VFLVIDLAEILLHSKNKDWDPCLCGKYYFHAL